LINLIGASITIVITQPKPRIMPPPPNGTITVNAQPTPTIDEIILSTSIWVA
jgi:hypothetical protein